MFLLNNVKKLVGCGFNKDLQYKMFLLNPVDFEHWQSAGSYLQYKMFLLNFENEIKQG